MLRVSKAAHGALRRAFASCSAASRRHTKAGTRRFAVALVALLWAPGLGAETTGKEAASMSLSLTSSSFAHRGEIPTKHTCEGQDVSPPLSWSGVPANARSLVLIVDDPDAPDPKAPKMTWVHWVLYDIPVSATGLPEGVGKGALPAGTKQGLNDWKRTGYGGPCPPIGRHRYFHKLYALDGTLGDLGTPTKDRLLEALEGRVLASTELVGTYEKKKR
jgi:Raf kinase inhibitor-like YbhB/YbcL family protein